MRTLIIRFIFLFTCCLLAGTHLHAWLDELQRPQPKNIASSLKDKLASLLGKRPEAIADLERQVRENGDAYYQSLGDREATIPCGTSKGYILDNNSSLLSGLKNIMPSKSPEDESSAGAPSISYREIIRRDSPGRRPFVFP